LTELLRELGEALELERKVLEELVNVAQVMYESKFPVLGGARGLLGHDEGADAVGPCCALYSRLDQVGPSRYRPEAKELRHRAPSPLHVLGRDEVGAVVVLVGPHAVDQGELEAVVPTTVKPCRVAELGPHLFDRGITKSAGYALADLRDAAALADADVGLEGAQPAQVGRGGLC